MSGTMETTKAGERSLPQRSLPQTVMALLRHYLGQRRNLMILAVAILGVGAYFNWGWFVAAGMAPLLLALAPCAAMCAVGLCMMPKKNAAESKPGELNAVDQHRASLGYLPDSTESKAGEPNATVMPSEPISSVKAGDRTRTEA